MRASTMRIAALKAATLAALCVLSWPIQADTVPLCGPVCFHSADSSPVEVTMAHELQTDRQARFKIPRSALIYASGYNGLKRNALPRHVNVVGPWFKFAIVAPDGRPFGEAVEELAHQKRLHLDTAATELRPNYVVVEVSIIGRDIPDDRLYSAYLLSGSDWTNLKSVEPFDGLPAKKLSFKVKNADGTTGSTTVDGHQTNYFPLDAEDRFLIIQCENQPNPIYWCRYIVRPNDLVRLHVHMSDFRVYGGRKFVQDRLTMVLRAYCEYDIVCHR